MPTRKIRLSTNEKVRVSCIRARIAGRRINFRNPFGMEGEQMPSRDPGRSTTGQHCLRSRQWPGVLRDVSSPDRKIGSDVARSFKSSPFGMMKSCSKPLIGERG